MKTRNYFNRYALFFIFLFLIFGFGLCSSIPATGQNGISSQNQTTIVFVDKTLSAKQDSTIQQKNNAWIHRIIQENIKIAGDKIIISYIYENSSSPTNIYEFQYQPPKPQKRHMSSSEARIEKIKYTKRLRAYKKRFTEQVIQKAFASESNRKSTDVVGSIKLLSDIAKSSNGNLFDVFYLSDMWECSSFQYLNKNKLASFQKAQTLAKQDLKRISTRFQLSTDCLKSVSAIHIIFPSQEMDADEMLTLLPQYWDVIFTAFGVQNISYH